MASLYQQGDYKGATEVAQKVLALAEREFGPEHLAAATSLNNLAALYHAQGQYAQAEPLHSRSLAIREKALGPNHPGRDGRVVRRYPSGTRPDDKGLMSDIADALTRGK